MIKYFIFSKYCEKLVDVPILYINSYFFASLDFLIPASELPSVFLFIILILLEIY